MRDQATKSPGAGGGEANEGAADPDRRKLAMQRRARERKDEGGEEDGEKSPEESQAEATAGEAMTALGAPIEDPALPATVRRLEPKLSQAAQKFGAASDAPNQLVCQAEEKLQETREGLDRRRDQLLGDAEGKLGGVDAGDPKAGAVLNELRANPELQAVLQAYADDPRVAAFRLALEAKQSEVADAAKQPRAEGEAKAEGEPAQAVAPEAAPPERSKPPANDSMFSDVANSLIDSLPLLLKSEPEPDEDQTPPPPPRPLYSDEIAELRATFADSINYGAVIITREGPLAGATATRTVGNNIDFSALNFLHPKGSPAAMTLNDVGRERMVHEMMHVWQYQHEGTAYILSSLAAQLDSWLAGDAGGADQYDEAMKAGKPFGTWNAEQQANFVKEYAVAAKKVEAAKTGGPAPDKEDLELLEKGKPYIEQVQKGELKYTSDVGTGDDTE